MNAGHAPPAGHHQIALEPQHQVVAGHQARGEEPLGRSRPLNAIRQPVAEDVDEGLTAIGRQPRTRERRPLQRMVQQSVAKARIRHGVGVILRRMTARYIHTCIRVQDIERSLRFYSHLGFEHRGRLNFGAAYNVYLGLPGGGDVLELTVNVGRQEPYDLGDGYNHLALVVDDLDAVLNRLYDNGIEPEKPPYNPGGREELPRICFVQDPDGYRIELIDKEFATPQDPPKEEWVESAG